jgi:hypothetical protein
MTNPSLTDERLAWIAAREALRTSSQGGLFRRVLLGLLSGRRTGSRHVTMTHAGSELQADIVGEKMMRYSIVVDELSRKLSDEERVTLRATGQLPEWFLPAAHLEVKNVKL